MDTPDFVSAVVTQLASRSPHLDAAFRDAIVADPGVVPTMKMQDLESERRLQQVLADPLVSLATASTSRNSSSSRSAETRTTVTTTTVVAKSGGPIIVIIDGLGGGNDRDETVVNLLAPVVAARHHQPQQQQQQQQQLDIRFLIVSRNLVPWGVRGEGKYMSKDDITSFRMEGAAVVDEMNRDLGVVLRRRLAEVREAAKLGPNWPADVDVQRLEELCCGGSSLYDARFAAVDLVCRFLRDPNTGHPAEKLKAILDTEAEPRTKEAHPAWTILHWQMGRMSSSLSSSSPMDRIHAVARPLVLLQASLPVASLAKLLDLPEPECQEMVDLLGPLFDPTARPSPASAGVPRIRPHCRDLIMERKSAREERLFSIKDDLHERLAHRCMEIMEQSLRHDMCNVKWPGTLVSEIPREKIDTIFSPELRYAVQYGLHHMEEWMSSTWDFPRKIGVRDFLQRHMLHWAEAYCLLGTPISMMDRSVRALVSRRGEYHTRRLCVTVIIPV